MNMKIDSSAKRYMFWDKKGQNVSELVAKVTHPIINT